MPEEIYHRRKTDVMPPDNDHDLLVRLDTKVGMLVNTLDSFTKVVTDSQKDLAERVARLEVKDSRDSGKFEAISADVQRSLSNHERINSLDTELATLKDEINRLRNTANWWDRVNSLGVALSTALGVWFGKH